MQYALAVRRRQFLVRPARGHRYLPVPIFVALLIALVVTSTIYVALSAHDTPPFTQAIGDGRQRMAYRLPPVLSPAAWRLPPVLSPAAYRLSPAHRAPPRSARANSMATTPWPDSFGWRPWSLAALG